MDSSEEKRMCGHFIAFPKAGVKNKSKLSLKQ
jgi:hypothetical protein